MATCCNDATIEFTPKDRSPVMAEQATGAPSPVCVTEILGRPNKIVTQTEGDGGKGSAGRGRRGDGGDGAGRDGTLRRCAAFRSRSIDWRARGPAGQAEALTFFIKRLFLRAAAFLWMTPLAAAESMRFMARRTASSLSSVPMVSVATLVRVRSSALIALLRS